jgi:hypothetical protein
MRRVLLSVLAVVLATFIAAPLIAQGAQPPCGADKIYTVEYY